LVSKKNVFQLCLFFVFPEILYPGDDERNRQRYIGQLNNGIPNGHGTMAWKDGQTFKGNMKKSTSYRQRH
jgi:hypothetical protein